MRLQLAHLLVNGHVLPPCALPKQIVQPVFGICLKQVLLNLVHLITQALQGYKQTQRYRKISSLPVVQGAGCSVSQGVCLNPIAQHLCMWAVLTACSLPAPILQVVPPHAGSNCCLQVQQCSYRPASCWLSYLNVSTFLRAVIWRKALRVCVIITHLGNAGLCLAALPFELIQLGLFQLQLLQ